ncbi:DUF4256 domain-containing protein [Facklamia hominis]|uniref:DUF4256 domain-containing protein n=1 Tax=Facklamia hominis TaxID=178214 RepID=A0AAJ1Q5P5_9LACT|nr:DUF4256 domain-containing protein [Facklamia hominis]MDK7187289.1 DUF4256 domain-containing protein [Facklamia hominis]
MNSSNNLNHIQTIAQLEALPAIQAIKTRFEAYPQRHGGISWKDLAAYLIQHLDQLAVLLRMEDTGGEVDLIAHDQLPFVGPIFLDCYQKAPKERESLCYDQAARLGRKKFPPASSVLEELAHLGSDLLTPDQYLAIQAHFPLDEKGSSWLLTPPAIRELGGALFGDYRYQTSFIYHNGAESYYKGRGFRTYLLLTDWPKS